MYLILFKTFLLILLLCFMIIPFIKSIFEPVVDKMENTMLGDIMEALQDYLDNGFDDYLDALAFTGFYLLYFVFVLVISLIFAAGWFIFIPFLVLSTFIYFIKKNE